MPRDRARVIAETWERISRPGTWLTSAERLAVVAESRRARTCLLCAERLRHLSPPANGAHDSDTDLAEVWVDAVHRVTTDSSRLTRSWVERVCDEIHTEKYVEMVGIIACAVTMDVFSLAIGHTLTPLPRPVAGEPSRITTPEASLNNEWVPTVHESVATGILIDHFSGTGPPTGSKEAGPIRKALTLVPAEQVGWTALTDVMYLDRAALSDFETTPRAITRPQIELVAARTSALNECFY